jgi:hypothetical protein
MCACCMPVKVCAAAALDFGCCSALLVELSKPLPLGLHAIGACN